MMKPYRVEILEPAPSMNTRPHEFVAASYAYAVEECRRLWLATGRSATLYSGNDTYWYHRIDSTGLETDRNFNSGVPATGRLTRPGVPCGR